MCHCLNRLFRRPFQSLDHFSIYDRSPLFRNKLQEISIQLQGNILRIKPDFDQYFNNTSSAIGFDSNCIKLLKDSHGIATSDRKIEGLIQNILVEFDNTKMERIVFKTPRMNYDNQCEVYKSIISAVVESDQREEFKHLKKIYINWPDIKPKMRELYKSKIGDNTILIE